MPLLASDAALLSASAVTTVLTGLVDENLGICAAFPVVGIAFLGLRGRYRRRLRLVALDEVPRVAGALSLAAMVLIALALLVGDADAPGRVVAPVWALATAVLSGGGAAIAVAQRRRRSRTVPTERALIIGAGLVGTHIARRLREHPEYGLEVCGFLDDDPPRDVHAAAGRPPILGAPHDLPRVAAETGARHVLIAFSAQTDRTLVPVVHCSRALGLELSIVPRLFDVVGEHALVEHVGGLPLLRLKPLDPHGWRFAVKDVIDRVAAAIALVLLAPLLLGIAVLIRLESPGPVFFRQVRVGRDGCRFELLKFRSMRPARTGPPSSGRRGTAPGGVEGERDAVVLHAGVDARLLRAAPAQPWRWRILYVGRLAPEKGVDTAIEALARLPADATLEVRGTGDPGYVAALQRSVAGLGLTDRVRFAGFATFDELPAIYAAADAVVFPSRWEEPFGLVPLEAMGVGRPVVSTAQGGSAEYLAHDVNAVVVPPSDPDALAEAVRRLAADEELRHHLREGGVRTASAHTLDGFAARMVGEIETTAARGRPRG